MSYYKKHIFLCTNIKEDCNKRCCGRSGAEDTLQYLKKQLKSLTCLGPGQFRVSSAGCMGRCAVGPALVIYPEGIWYSYQNRQDIDEILEKSILGNSVIERLLL